MALALVPVAALTLAGCWTPPNANVQPTGNPGLIQDGIAVQSVKDPATVQAIDAGTRTITLKLSDKHARPARSARKWRILGNIQVGDQVQATVTEKLAIYVLENGKLPDGTTAETLGRQRQGVEGGPELPHSDPAISERPVETSLNPGSAPRWSRWRPATAW